MNRIFILSLLVCSNIYATEIEKCPNREVIFQAQMRAPQVTELREGSVLLLGLVEENGKIKSTKILSQEGDPRWGKQAVQAMVETRFEPASKACEFEYLYTATFEGNEREN